MQRAEASSARRVVVAPDKFRGTASAAEVAAALARGASARGYEPLLMPMADGGEGTLEAFGGANRATVVQGPDARPVTAQWRLDGELAVIELAQASGLVLAGGAEGNDPIAASTAGTGELVNAAIRAGARTVIVAAGGSATTDGGAGALAAIDRQLLAGVRVLVACDVRTRFLDAAEVFAPQKGADADGVRELADRLQRLAHHYRREYGVDVTGVPGGGAAGGFGGGMLALGAELRDGFTLVAERNGLGAALERAAWILTGEGCLDRTSFTGKVVGGVIALAAERGVTPAVVAGTIEYAPEGLAAVSLVDEFGRDAAFTRTTDCAEAAVARVLPPA